MCGRFLIDTQAVQSAMRIASVPNWIQGELELKTIYPSTPSLILQAGKEGLEGVMMPFGYYCPSMKKRLINARAETAQQKWMFRHAFLHHRCAAVCAQFYEWDSAKNQIAFALPDQPLYLACVAIEDSFVILTRPANKSMAPFHHRMPVCLGQEQVQAWIEDVDQARTLLEEAGPWLEHHFLSPQGRLFE